jgi:type VI secretion system secreted protein Hcp
MAMAVDMFVNFKSSIAGSALDKAKSRELQISGFHFGGRRPSGTQAGQGPAGRGALTDLTFTKAADISSPNLFTSSMHGRPFSEVTLSVRKAGEKPLEYITLKMTKVVVAAYDLEGGDAKTKVGDIALNEIERVQLNFQKIEFTYSEQSDTGLSGVSMTDMWDAGAT